jgi:hypothetical protein
MDVSLEIQVLGRHVRDVLVCPQATTEENDRESSNEDWEEPRSVNIFLTTHLTEER